MAKKPGGLEWRFSCTECVLQKKGGVCLQPEQGTPEELGWFSMDRKSDEEVRFFLTRQAKKRGHNSVVSGMDNVQLYTACQARRSAN